MVMLSVANLLIFDEPTNHLDVESIEALEDALEDYDGTVLLVSHDRALLRGLTTRVWILHDGNITDFPGSFEEWETASRERDHAASVAAAEAGSLRKVKERKQMRRPDDGREQKRSARREAERAVVEAEAAVSQAELQVAALRSKLEDPHLYLTPQGVRRAVQLGREMEEACARLDQALAGWEAATRDAESAG
jgi:ATP-binding cassette subfamily F protein 3